MEKYTVKQLARLASISVRTLHHYDALGLLKPALKSDKGYRFYTKAELFKLQQIMFFKELGLELRDIQDILEKPDFDLAKALASHRIEISKRLDQFQKLLTTIDKTIKNFNTTTMLKDEEMYEGFTPEQVESNRKEVVKRWGEKSLHDSENKIRKMSKKQWGDVKAQGEAITKKLATLMDKEPSHREVQECIADWHRYLENFYPVTEERLRGLGNLYVDDVRFTAYYEKYRIGLADFKNRAIQIYCDHGMKVVG